MRAISHALAVLCLFVGLPCVTPAGEPLVALYGHTDAVHTVAVTAHGLTAVTGSSDNTVKLWRLSDGALLRTLTGHTSLVRSVAIAPHDQTIVSGSADKTIGVWRVSDGELLRTLAGHTGQVRSIAISPDGQTIVSGSSDNLVKVWRLSDGELLRTLAGHTGFVQGVAITPDGETIVSAASDGARAWRLSDGQLVGTLTTMSCQSVAVANDGRTVVLGGVDYATSKPAIEVRQLLDGPLLNTLIGSESDAVSGLDITPDGRTIVSAGGDGMRVWRSPDGLLVRTLPVGDASSVCVYGNGQACAVACRDHTTRVW